MYMYVQTTHLHFSGEMFGGVGENSYLCEVK